MAETKSNEMEQRTAVVAEALTWLRTPYHTMGRIKGAGVDCYTLLAEVFSKAGLFTAEEEFYPRDWFLHARQDEYKMRILRHAREMVEKFCSATEMTAPGNIVLVRIRRKVGDIDAHGGVITAWPMVLHAFPPIVNEVNALTHPAFMAGKLEFYSPWEKPHV